MRLLQLPLSEETVRSLRVGEAVSLSGRLFTARDAAHAFLVSHNEIVLPDLKNAVLYHCGPVIVKRDGEWIVTAAGPTTSSREEPYEATVIERYGIRAIIGKGGMGARTAEACRAFGCVYLQAAGGAAQVLAACVKRVVSVHYDDQFGAPEAIWEFDVQDFPAIVTMDATGASIHERVKEASASVLGRLFSAKEPPAR